MSAGEPRPSIPADCSAPKRKLSERHHDDVDDEKRPRLPAGSSFPAGAFPPPPPPSIASRPPLPPHVMPTSLGGRPLLLRAPPPPPGIRPPPRPPSLASSSPALAKPTPAAPLAFKKGSKPLAIKLGAPSKPSTSTSASSAHSRPKVAAIFGDDDEDDEDAAEEMPTEARMRMRNVGRETITSSGPNSFGKTRQGFVDSKRLFERQLQKAMEDVCEENKK